MAEDGIQTLEALGSRVRSCTQCPLCRSRTQAVPGEGPAEASIVLVGEAPGRREDAAGRPFVGAAGRVLEQALASAGLRREAVFVTNVVKCRPPSNRAPKGPEVAACRPYLVAQIAAIRPSLIVALGSTSVRSLLGSTSPLSKIRGKRLRFGEAVLMPTYHPAAILYNRNLERSLAADLRTAVRWASRSGIRSGPPRRGRPHRSAVSGGAAVVDRDDRILLLHRANERRWCLPKGAREAGESLRAAAVREVREETGLEVALGSRLTTVRYAYYWPPERANIDKRVTYYLARPTGGTVHLEAGFDGHRWVRAAEALRLLPWPNDRRVVRLAFAVGTRGRVRRRRTGPAREDERSPRRRL